MIANAVGVAGVATGIGEGVTTIAATGISSSVFGSTSLTVQPVVAVATHQAPRARDVRIFPNPLRARSLQIAVGASRSDPVGVTIYDVTGRRLREIASDPYVPGPRTILWDGRDERGEDVPNGMYFVRLTGGGFRHVGRVTVLR